MGGLGSSARVVLALVLVSALVACTSAVFAGFDGRPRPKSMDDKPALTFGAKPAVKYKGQPANCIWYSWENPFYKVKYTQNCSTLLWDTLSNDPTAVLGAYNYYQADIFYIPTEDEYLCVIGCFDLSATGGPTPAPSTSPAPPELPVVAIPPVTSSPPATPPATSSPPSSSPAKTPEVPPAAPSTPPPATLFRPPPPGLPLPPSGIVLPTPTSTTTGPSGAPGPETQAGAGTALRVLSSASILVISAVAFGFAL